MFQFNSRGPLLVTYLKDKEAQLPQLFLTGGMLQPLNDLCQPLLDLLQEFHVSCAKESRSRHRIPDAASLLLVLLEMLTEGVSYSGIKS